MTEWGTPWILRNRRTIFISGIFTFILVCRQMLIPDVSPAYERYNRVVKFDRHFSKYSKRFFGPAFDWRYFKSQAIAESRLEPNARSRVGARGIMQIMPRTYKDIQKKNPMIKGQTASPKWNIAAGISYNRMLWKVFKAKRPFTDRLNFMFGAYNAGKGNIIKAQKAAKEDGTNPNLWASITSVLHRITGKRSRETIHYVNKIHKIKGVLR